MLGIRIKTWARFAEIIAPLSAEAERLFWLLDLPSGPFFFPTDSDWNELDRQLEPYYVDFGEEPMTSAGLWRPGILPRFAPLLIHDEWSYFVGLEGPEEAARAGARALSLQQGYHSPACFAALAEHGQLFAMLRERDWEVYTPRSDWLARLSRQWPAEPTSPPGRRAGPRP